MGRTSFGLADLNPEDLAPFIHEFFDGLKDSNHDSFRLKLATDDLNAFYLEATFSNLARPRLVLLKIGIGTKPQQVSL